MLGHSHSLSGAVTGAAAGILLHWSPWQTMALAGITAGMALLPDMDKCGSASARSLGFLSEAVARVIAAISGGHRHTTHSALGIALFTAWAWAGAVLRHHDAGKAMLALLIVLAVAGGVDALHLFRGHWSAGHADDLIGIAAAFAVAWHGWELALIPLAVLIGTTTHIAGDMLTDSGCMLGYPASKYRFHLLPEPFAFTTGTRPELLIVDPLLTGALLYCCWLLLAPFLPALLATT